MGSFAQKATIILTAFFVSHAEAIAQEAETTAQDVDETDLSRFMVVDDDKKFLTIAEIEELMTAAKERISAEGCEAALSDILAVQEAANQTSNIIRQGIEPFYNASRDDKDRVLNYMGPRLEFVELMSNTLLGVRNEFWVIEAECLLEMGDVVGGVNRMFRALNFIDALGERELWERARTQLWEQVGFTLD